MLPYVCDYEVVIVITDDQSMMDDIDGILKILVDKKIPVFFLSYLRTIHASHRGGFYAVC